MSNTSVFNLLHAIVGNGQRAQRHAPMTASGKAKYFTVHQPLTDDQIAAHLLGTATYAVPLIGIDGLASAGLPEQDYGGIEMARRILAAGEACGVVMFAIVCKGSIGHDGCHPWALYDGRYDPAAICAQMKQIAEAAGASTDEIHPNNTNIRLPFGMHLRSKSRGKLLLQTGEIFDLDDSAELEAGESALLTLPLNPAPPAIPVPQRPASASVVVVVESARARAVRTSTGKIDTRAIGAEVKRRFNAAHTWAELLTAYGGTATRDGWACACGCQHTHDTQIAITSQDRIVSYSPNCRWAPYKDSRKALDRFGFYCDRAHGGDYRAAVETLARAYGLWVEPRRQREAASLTEPPARFTDEQRAAYNANRRDLSHQETREALNAIYAQACNLDFTSAVPAGANAEAHADRARRLFAYLHGICHERAVLQVAPTNEQITADLEMSRRNATYAFREIEASGLGKRQGGKAIKGQPNEAATWTFFRLPNLACKPHQEAICMHDYKELDSTLTLRACERAAPLAADSLDAWEWAEVDHGADELRALDAAAAHRLAEPEAEEVPEVEPDTAYSELLIYVYALACALGQPRDYAGYTFAQLEGEATHLAALLDQPAAPDASQGTPMQSGNPYAVEPEIADEAQELGGGWIGYAGGAAFKADYEPTHDAQPAPTTAPVIIQLDPLEQAPPLSTDAAYSCFIWRWYASQPGAKCKKTGKAYTDAQRAKFKREAESYLVDVSPAEATLRWDALRRTGRLTRPNARAPSQALPARRPALDAIMQRAIPL